MKKAILKFASLFFAVTMLLSAFTGCNSKQGAATTNHETISVWHGASGASAKYLQTITNQYMQANKNVTVNLVFVDANTMVQKLTAAAAGKALPDADLVGWPQYIGPWKDIILPLNDFIKKYPSQWNESDFLSSILEGNGRFNGVTYGIPMEVNNLALYYNKKLFSAAGLTPPTTWSELVTDATKLTDPAKKQWGINLPTTKGESLSWTWECFLWQAGGQFASADGKQLLFNSPAGIQATQLFVDMVNKYKCASIAPPQNGFMTGLIAMNIDGPWDIPTLETQKDLDWGIAPLPAGPTGIKATNIGGTVNMIFKTDAQHELASWNFLTWLASPAINAQFAVGYGTIPIRKSGQNEQVWKDFVSKTPDIQVHIDSFSYGHMRPYAITSYSNISDVLSSHLEAALYQKETATQAMQKAYDESKPLLATWLQ